MEALIAAVVLVVLVLLVAVSCIKIVPQAHAAVIERLGGYLATWGVGIHFKAPFIDRVAKRVLLSAPNLVKCSKCGELMMPHRVCKACGSYNKKEIISVD